MLATHCRDRCGCFPDPVLPDNLLLVECLRASPKGFTRLVLLVGPHACAAPVNLLRTKIVVLWVWGGALYSAFLTGSQERMRLVLGP